MNIRHVSPDELEQHCRVSSMAFMWSVNLEEEEFPKNPVFGAFDDDGTLMAELEYFPHNLFFCDKTLPCIGIGGVATLPEYRRRGTVRALFNKIENLAEKNGWVMGVLYPFSHDYYRKFGYEAVMKSMTVDAKVKALEVAPRNCNATIYEGKNSDELYNFYNKIARQTNLMFERTEDTVFSSEPFKTMTYTYIWRYENGEPGAVFTYSICRKTRTLKVNEMLFKNKAALLGVLGFIRNYDNQVETISFEKLPVDSPLLNVLTEYSQYTMSVKTHAAVRIFDIEKVLKTNSYPDEYGEFTVKTIDSIDKNRGIFHVEYQNGNAKVERKSAAEYDISMNAPCASKLLLSGEGFDYDSASYLNGIELNNEAKDFFRAFPKRKTLLFEGF
ncbi:MAG TPA: GNAT family N-acetyltransferase [Clostridia bacterium]|nr:GNAT family N-acetyltransferase [Clostridia bacterium]